MHSTFALIVLVAALTSTVSADFFLSNSTICMGAFPMQGCRSGPNVFSGVSNVTDFTCNKLMHAMDYSYVHNGTAGPTGTPNLYAKNVCGAGDLVLSKQYDTSGKDAGYVAKDASGKQVATCQLDPSQFTKHCPVWIGAFFFETEYMCKSDTINCG
jgi:hypothetical protein